MAMTDPTPDTSELVGMKVRIPKDLHAGVAEAARVAGMSMNTWLVRKIGEAVLETAPTPPAAGGRRVTASYLAEVSFTLSGNDVDTQAHRLTEQMVNMTELAGGAAVGSRVIRAVPIQVRNQREM